MLGSGTFGHVFLAEDSRLPKKIALKTLDQLTVMRIPYRKSGKPFSRTVGKLYLVISLLVRTNVPLSRTMRSSYGAFYTVLPDSNDIPASQHYCPV